MKIIDYSIRLIDILETNNKEIFDKELKELQTTPSVNNVEWESVPISRGRRKSFTLKITDELNFLKSINVDLIQYQNFSSGIMVTLEGKLTPESIEVFTSQNYEENKNLFEQYSKKIWNFWREKIKSTLLVNDELINIEPIAINHLKFNVDNYSEVLNNVLEANANKDKLKSIILILSKYGVNTIGLISLLFPTDKRFSILAQNRSVYRNDSFDYTGISLFDFKSSTWNDFEISTHIHKILSLLHFLFWLNMRKQQISEWKNKIDKLSKSIREFEGKLLEPNTQKMNLSIYEQKGLFQTEYASFMDERRFISTIASQQIQQKNDTYYGEQLIATQITEKFPTHDGLLANISNDILNLVENLKEEYDVIKEQYKILGEELSEILNFANAQSNLKLSSEGQKIQNSMKRQGVIMIFSTIAVLSLTGVLLYINIQQISIENFEPYVTAAGGEMQIHGSINPSYNYEPEIKVGAKTNHFLNFSITDVKFLDGSTFSNCYFIKKPDVKLWQKPFTIVGTNGALESLKPFVMMDFSVNSTYWDTMYGNEIKTPPSIVGELIFDIDISDLQDKTKNHLHQQVYVNLIANLSSTQQANCH